MSRTRQPYQPARPVSFQTSGVALWLVFLLATHTFWCGLAGSDCQTDIMPGAALSAATRAIATVAMVVTHSITGITDTDVCASVDENMNLPCAFAPLVVAPALLWIALVRVVAVAASVVVALWQRAAVFGRDGPVSVPPLVGRLVRASLPHRAPPVTLI